jgi:membrane-associated phospholipid phosphatase
VAGALTVVRAADQPSRPLPMMASDVGCAATTTWQVMTSPFHARGQDYLLAGGVLGAVALTSLADRSVRASARDSDVPWQRTVADVGHWYQTTWVTAGAACGLYATGLLFDRPNVRRTGMEVAEAFALASAGTQILKTTVGRDRPYAEKGPYHFVGPHLKNKHSSFPSGDVTTAFALSTVLAAEARSVPVTVAVYTLAATTAFQRLKRDQHWLSDTVGAAVWATAVGLSVVRHHRACTETRGKLAVTAGPGKFGIVLNL